MVGLGVDGDGSSKKVGNHVGQLVGSVLIKETVVALFFLRFFCNTDPSTASSSAKTVALLLSMVAAKRAKRACE